VIEVWRVGELPLAELATTVAGRLLELGGGELLIRVNGEDEQLEVERVARRLGWQFESSRRDWGAEVVVRR
jgi:hypothetical protein